MAEEQGHNGFTNYETWSVALIIDNERETHKQARTLVRGTLEHVTETRMEKPYWSTEEHRKFAVGEALKLWVEDEIGDIAEALPKEYRDWRYLISQLVSAALSEVDWDDLAEHFLSELVEEVS